MGKDHNIVVLAMEQCYEDWNERHVFKQFKGAEM